MMGCSNAHSQGQVWSLSVWYPLSQAWSLLLCNVAPSNTPCEYIRFEVSLSESQSRVIVKSEHFVALGARWPFEILRE